MTLYRENEGITTGMPVLAADGKQLGEIAEVHGSYFKVAAPRTRDYWISGEYVRSLDGDSITLSFEHDQLDEHKLMEPGIEPEEDPFRKIRRETVITEREQLETRARMERELAEQRQRLGHTHPEGENAPPDTGGTVGEPVESELPRVEDAVKRASETSGGFEPPPPPDEVPGGSGAEPAAAGPVQPPVDDEPDDPTQEMQWPDPPENPSAAMREWYERVESEAEEQRHRRADAQGERLRATGTHDGEEAGDPNRPFNGGYRHERRAATAPAATGAWSAEPDAEKIPETPLAANDPALNEGIVDTYPPSVLEGRREGYERREMNKVTRSPGALFAAVGAAIVAAMLWVTRKG